MKVAVLDDYQGASLQMADWGVLPADTQVTVFRDHLSSTAALADRLKEFDIVATMRERTPFGRDLLAQLPNLKLLVVTGTLNPEIMDVDAATDMGVTVCGTQALHRQATPPKTTDPVELAWGLILAVVRHIPAEDAALRQDQWQTTLGTRLAGKVLGILGLGHLGSQMATIGAAFGMSVIAWSQNLSPEKAAMAKATWVTKDELFARSDIVTIHLKLSARNKGIVGARELGLMRPESYLINTSRGPLVDEAALVQALRHNVIAGAGIDVYEEEPLPPNHPLKLLRNTVLTPHIGFVTKERYREWYSMIVENIAAFLKGQPIRVLNPSVLEGSPKHR